MTRAVVVVRPDAGFKEVADLLAAHGITAVPVVDADDRPIGVVSEADLLRKEAGQEDPSRLMPPPALGAADRAKRDATTARDLMSAPAVCARPEWSVVEAARVTERHRVKRLPVVDETGRLVGVVSRSDLLRVFLRQDRAIQEEIATEVLARSVFVGPDEVAVAVDEGRVTLTGTVEHRSLVPILLRLCGSVDGVVSVDTRLGYRMDDSDIEPVPPPPYHGVLHRH